MLALHRQTSSPLRALPLLLLVGFRPHTAEASYQGGFNLPGVIRAMLGLSKAAAPSMSPPPQPMKVIGAGFGRTGSDSLRLALNQIGFKSYHMKEAFEQRHLPQWAAHARGELSSEDVLDLVAVEGYNATTDFPASLLTFELLKRNPGAKVILSVRDSPEKWAESFISTIGGAFPTVIHRIPVRWLPSMAEFRDVCPWIDARAGVLHGDDGLPTFSSSVAAYTAWVNRVQEEVPTHQLLVHNAKEGWGPICEFLNFSPHDGGDGSGTCPTGPYPNVNDSASMRAILQFFSTICDLFPLFVLAVVIGVVAVARSNISRRCLLGKEKAT